MSNVANKAQSWGCREGVHNSGVVVGDNEHIAFMNRLKTAHAGAVESFSFYKCLDFKLVQWHPEVLPRTGNIDKLEVYHFDAMLFSKLQYLFWGHYLSLLLLPIPAPLLEYWISFQFNVFIYFTQ